MTIKEKILTFLDSKGIKKAEFFESIGIAPSNFKGAAKLTELGGDKIVRILTSFPELSADWLMRNEGTMTRILSEEEPDDNQPDKTHKEVSAQTIEPIVDKLLNTIQNQSEEIGRLKERNAQLEREKNDSSVSLQATPVILSPSTVD